MNTPFDIIDITNIKDLYGRDAIIRKLVILAKRCENASLIGARRFGKTCLLCSTLNHIKNDKDICVYPIYLDFKTENIKGTDSAYRYMISILVTTLNNDGVFTNKEKFGSIEIQPSDDWTEVDEQLEQLSCARLQSCLKRIILFFSEYLGKTILFAIDEYEYLFKYVLDTPAGFMKLRDLSTSVLDNGLRPFIFWISGALSWDYLCSVIGSGECNPISATEFVNPIEKSDFELMWNNECRKIENLDIRKYVLSNIDFAYEKSGGVPFYGKLIGAHLIRNNKIPDYSICSPFFKEMITKTLSDAEQNILKAITRGTNVPKNSLGYSTLEEKGLIKTIKSKPVITVSFLKDFLLADMADASVGKNKKLEHEILVNEIYKIIENINKTQENRGRKYIFKPTVDSVSTYKDLMGPCFSSEPFAEFACALYRIYFEWTKETKPRELLPNNNFRYNIFSQYVDIARHSLGGAHQMDTFNLSEGKASKADMLQELLGTVNEPKDSQEFYKLQLNFLKMFKDTLVDIQKFVRKN